MYRRGLAVIAPVQVFICDGVDLLAVLGADVVSRGRAILREQHPAFQLFIREDLSQHLVVTGAPTRKNPAVRAERVVNIVAEPETQN